MSTIRPRIIPSNRWWDYVCMWVGGAVVFCNVLYTIVAWRYLPSKIPTHFASSGEPNEWAGKENLIGLPLVSILLYVFFLTLRKYPWLMNYPVKVTERNALSLYGYARLLMEILGMESSLLLFSLQTGVIRTAMGKQNGLGSEYLAIVIGISVFILGLFIVLMLNKSRRIQD